MAKMKIKVKGKKWIKTIALALAGVAAITAVGFGVKAIVDYTKNDLKKISPSFEVGNLGNDGKFVDDESTLYTKEAFGCYGLQVKPDFDSTVNYQIFYYDILDNYISSTSFMSDGYSEKAPINGAYARIVIEPQNDEDGKISFTEKIKYPSQLTVKVKKEQDINNRYTVFKGQLMEVVQDIDSLVFTKALWFSPTTMSWSSNSVYCVTSTTLLKVEGGSKLKFDFSSLDENYRGAFVRVYQFKDLPLDENMIVSGFGDSIGSASNVDNPFVLDKRAKYIFISLNVNKSEVLWTDEVLQKLPSCFSITKTK